MVRASWHAVSAICVVALAVAGCGSNSSRRDATAGNDAMGSSDTSLTDHPGVDGGSDGLLCFDPTDCLSGQVCCLRFENTIGTVSCQEGALCPGDGVTTYIACATDADCPTAAQKCLFLASAANRDFNICQ